MVIEYITICFFSLLGSGLTFFSGFGLGTILVPIFAIFFPLELAISLTAIVHFLNNAFKLYLVGKNANRNIVLKFGIPAIVSAFIGAYILTLISDMEPILMYSMFNISGSITITKLIVGGLLFFFALFDIIPGLSKLEFNKKYIPLGGFLSGFFGGLSGNQGALRTAFLIRAGLSKEQFVATGVVIAILIDISRLGIYSSDIVKQHDKLDYLLLTMAVLSAFLGAYAGNKLLKKVTIRFLQNFVAIMLLLFSILLMTGIL
ncbi:sulfite exporter TauE/SafE family protein [Fluviicola taffensis]|uniref:Probable membrane transporter protein n=1 Tax=Fluviicola taffensis (strain DSM 16823 / NCIMB 13979 / RW262) TaxID=755732 RepID=F2I9K2_FLUTR|nr:sulfite exporter TauE/SafE family protein [Fluviicola taffensis]AEA45183.1 protein of unknown function DUF81 [Fluviicola taffensis DSM 16823]